MISLLTGSLVWGLIWYPYRALGAAGIGGALSSLLTYLIPLLLGMVVFRHQWPALKASPGMATAIGLAAGWCNLAYVLAMLSGEVMQVMLLFYLAPLWTVLFAYVLLGEKPGWAGALVVALATSGAVIMLWQPGARLPVPSGAADWLALSSGMTFALSNVLSRRARALDVRAKSLAIWAGVSLVACVVLMTGTEAVPAGSVLTWPVLLILLTVGLVIMAANLVVQEGVTHVSANQAIVVLLTELVFAAIGAYLLAGERMAWHQWLGGALIVTATLLSGRLQPAGSDET